MKKLEDQIAVVTGAGSGIGRAIATRFAAEGARVVAFDVDEESVTSLAAEIVESGGQAVARLVDVSSEESVRAGFDSLERVDILVNNAGIASIGNLENTTPEEFDRVFAINVKGIYQCLRVAIPSMRARKSGVILNLASIASKLGIQDRFAYSASKGAVLSMTLSVARDYVEHGIRCNCICPARVHTPFVDTYLEEHYPDTRDEMFAKLSAFQPIGRMGTPDEIAALACFLCSEESSFITGATYDIDGGVSNLR
jgi:NAD(P)-dependent dehydrogenase (short-subunit alcohol dehydrogenase family)